MPQSSTATFTPWAWEVSQAVGAWIVVRPHCQVISGSFTAIVAATTYHDKPDVIAEVSAGLGKAMRGLDVATMPHEELLATRGW